MKLLVLTPEPVDANLLRSVLGEEVEGAEVLVVSPATNQSKVAFTGESEPAVAIRDALATFAADRIVVFSHPEGDRDYREDEGLADVEQRLGIPLTHALIER